MSQIGDSIKWCSEKGKGGEGERVGLEVRKREREREREGKDREIERETERDKRRHADRQTQTDTDRHRQTRTDTDRKKTHSITRLEEGGITSALLKKTLGFSALAAFGLRIQNLWMKRAPAVKARSKSSNHPCTTTPLHWTCSIPWLCIYMYKPS